MLLRVPVAAGAQAVAAPHRAARPSTRTRSVEFSADQVTYDSNADIVTASGDVRMKRDGNYLAADQVCGTARPARSTPRAMSCMLTPQGDKLIGDNVQLTDTMRDGTIDNLLVVLESGGRIAAQRGTRATAVTTLTTPSIRRAR